MTDAKILELAKKRFHEILDYESEERIKMQDDNRFAMVDQWSKTTRDNREAEGFERPTLTIPILDQYLNYVNNNSRQNSPSTTVSPVDGGAQEKHAKNRQGLLKHIQYETKSKMAHDVMFENATKMGRGHCIINTEFVNEESFDQKIVVDSVPDPLMVFMDVRKQKPDYSDCKFGFLLETTSRDQFESDYPKKSPTGWESAEVYDVAQDNDDIVLAQYWALEEVNDELLSIEQIVDGKPVRTKILRSKLDDKPDKTEILESRKVKVPTWWWYKLSGKDVLEKRQLLCKEIPIITMIGKEGRHKGKFILYGLTRRLKGSCEMYNYISSTEMEFMDLNVKAPYIVAKGQTEGLPEWDNANTVPYTRLRYKPVVNGSQPVPPPQKAPPTQPSAAHIQMKMEIKEDLKAISGLGNANFGGRTNENSGVAIRERKMEGDNSTFHFNDNLGLALTHECRVMNQMMPKVYQEGRIISILGKEDEVETQQIGKMTDGDEFSLGDGYYSVVCELGPTHKTARQESLSGMIEMARYVPAIGQAAPDLVIKQTDFPGKDALADRAKKFVNLTLGPQVTSPMIEENNEKAILSQQLMQTQQQLQQIQQQAQQMQEEFQKIDQQKIQTEAQKAQNEQAKLQIEQAKVQQEGQIAARQAEIKKYEIDVGAHKVDIQEDTKIQISDKDRQAQDERLLLEAQLKAQEGADSRQSMAELKARELEAKNVELTHTDHEEYREGQAKELQGIKESVANISIEPKTEVQAPTGDINVQVIMEPQKSEKKTIKKNENGDYEVIPEDKKE